MENLEHVSKMLTILPDDEAGKLMKASVQYAISGTEPEDVNTELWPSVKTLVRDSVRLKHETIYRTIAYHAAQIEKTFLIYDEFRKLRGWWC